MAGKTIVGTDKHERALRWMKNEIQSLKNRLSQAGMGEVTGEAYEPALGNPLVDHYVLESTIAGVRAWVANGGVGPKLTAIEALANAAGWLHNDGAGAFAYSTPSAANVGADPAGTGHTEAAAHVTAHASLITGVHGLVFTAGKSLTLTESLTLNALPIGGLAVATGANTLGPLADVADGSYLASGGVGAVPAWVTLNQAAVAGLTTASSPEHVGMKLSGLTASVPVVTDASKNLASVSYATFKASLAIAQADVSGLTIASGPTFDHLHITNAIIAGGSVTSSGNIQSIRTTASANFYGDIYSATPGHYPALILRKSAGANPAVEATTSDTDVLGEIRFYGVNAAATPDWGMGAYIWAIQDGAAGASYVPAKLMFMTYSTAVHYSMTCSASGGVNIGGTGDIEDNALFVTGKFGCNGAAVQGAYASGGAITPGAGAYGASSAANFAAMVTLVQNIRAALVANGIMN